MSGPSITAAIIALDEEHNLSELLPRLDWVDQVVLVDGGSRDATLRVARAYGCQVVSRRLDGFAAQRNRALELATGEWVLSIDADERPTPRLVAEIRRRIQSSRHVAYRVPIRSTVLGRNLRRCGTQDDCPVRLFRRRAGRWVGGVHEVLHLRGRVGRLHNWLTHHTQHDLNVFLSKMHQYTTLEVQARLAAGRPPRPYDPWLAPAREIFRRLIVKQGLLDGPAGWSFCLLSGLYEWVLADRHRRAWPASVATADAKPQAAAGLLG